MLTMLDANKQSKEVDRPTCAFVVCTYMIYTYNNVNVYTGVCLSVYAMFDVKIYVHKSLIIQV